MTPLSEKKTTDSHTIPKIIHYCWFGGKPIPPNLQRCIDTWEKLGGYQIMRWDESNCSFDENEFVRRTYAEHKLGFIGDYYRLKAVYEYGGIYLDTDVKVYKDFNPLLMYPAFFNFIFNCSVGTAIIGAQKGNPMIRGIMDMYDRTEFGTNEDGRIFNEQEGKLIVNGYPTSNYYYTYYILHHYPDFVLNNRFQNLGDFVIFPKEMFEIGSLTGKHYAIHLNAGEWRPDGAGNKGIRDRIKCQIAAHQKLFDFIQILVRKVRYRKLNRAIPFYEYSVAQRRHTELPEL